MPLSFDGSRGGPDVERILDRVHPAVPAGRMQQSVRFSPVTECPRRRDAAQSTSIVDTEGTHRFARRCNIHRAGRDPDAVCVKLEDVAAVLQACIVVADLNDTAAEKDLDGGPVGEDLGAIRKLDRAAVLVGVEDHPADVVNVSVTSGDRPRMLRGSPRPPAPGCARCGTTMRACSSGTARA